MNVLLNIVMIFLYIKLKEYKNARQLSLENLAKLKEQNIFRFEDDDIIPFSLKYMSCISLFLETANKKGSEAKNAALIELYKL